MTSKYDVAIIGAGIVGAACAREAVRAKLKTAIIEAKIIGGGAAGAGMGPGTGNAPTTDTELIAAQKGIGKFDPGSTA